MPKPVLKIVLQGENSTLEIYEKEPGIMVFDMHDDDNDGICGSYIEVETGEYLELLSRLLPEVDE